MNKRLLFAVAISVIIISAVLFAGTLIQAQSNDDDAGISNKLDEILTNQKKIMDDIAYMKEELRIIKVRVTQAQ